MAFPPPGLRPPRKLEDIKKIANEFDRIRKYMELEKYYNVPEFPNLLNAKYHYFSGLLGAKYQDKKINKKEYKELKELNHKYFQK